MYLWSLQVSTLQQDLQVKEKQYEVKLQALEDSHRQSTLELRDMLAAQQQMSAKYDHFHSCLVFCNCDTMSWFNFHVEADRGQLNLLLSLIHI